MFQWFKAWRIRRRLRQRRLFQYWNGRAWKYGDPFALWRALLNHATVNFDTMLPLVDVGSEPETTQVLAALCEVFGVEQFNPETGYGLTNGELLGLLSQFQLYLATLKKTTNSGQTSSPVADSKSSIGPEPPDEATKPSLDSGSTATASTAGVRT